MIISIRYMVGRWHWELYDIGRETALCGTGKYAQGDALTWANMILNLELCVAELEKNMSYLTDTIRLLDWCNGSSKRTSNYTGDIFLTRKDKCIFDRAFLQPRDKFRYNGPCYSARRRRRTKSTWGPRET